MPAFERNNLRFVYDCAGDPRRPAVILLHGFTSERSSWHRHLQELSDEYFVIAPDARGHGESAVPESLEHYAMDEFAEDVKALAEHLDLDRYALVGCSFGGMIACHFATRWPERLWALVLSDASPAYASERYREEFRERERGINAQEAIVREHGMEELANRAVANASNPALAEALRRRYERVTAQGFIGAAHTRRSRPNLIPLLRDRLTMPVMLVTGDQDPVRSAFTVMHEELPGARALTFEGTGHGVPMLRPAPFLAELRSFFSDARAGTSVAGTKQIPK